MLMCKPAQIKADTWRYNVVRVIVRVEVQYAICSICSSKTQAELVPDSYPHLV